MVFVNKEVWKAFLERRAFIRKRKAANKKTGRIKLMLTLKRDNSRLENNALNSSEKNSRKSGNYFLRI